LAVVEQEEPQVEQWVPLEKTQYFQQLHPQVVEVAVLTAAQLERMVAPVAVVALEPLLVEQEILHPLLHLKETTVEMVKALRQHHHAEVVAVEQAKPETQMETVKAEMELRLLLQAHPQLMQAVEVVEIQASLLYLVEELVEVVLVDEIASMQSPELSTQVAVVVAEEEAVAHSLAHQAEAESSFFPIHKHSHHFAPLMSV
jgi:hypothetical protein